MGHLALVCLVVLASLLSAETKSLTVIEDVDKTLYEIEARTADDFDEEEDIRTNSIPQNPRPTYHKIKPKIHAAASRLQPSPGPKSSSEIHQQNNCNLSSDLVKEIASYQNITNLILKTVLNGTFKGRTYNDLGFFVDKFGSRLTGTANLEDAIDFMLSKMEQDELDNVHGEEVEVPRWVRGEEVAELILPRRKRLAILGLGYTIGTPSDGITAEVLVVRSFDELKQKADKAKGKIIVFNEVFTTYGESVQYRGRGAVEAAKVGGLASLVRSVTPFSINSPHTGMQDYEQNVTQIPNACITIEDAEFLQRCQDRGWKIVIQLKMNDYMLPVSKSRNVVGEIIGRESPSEVVVVSGHIDSWDVGSGAMDDGGGAFISEEALALLKFLKLRPRRTLRSILWTGEELGLIGVQKYIEQHRGIWSHG